MFAGFLCGRKKETCLFHWGFGPDLTPNGLITSLSWFQAWYILSLGQTFPFWARDWKYNFTVKCGKQSFIKYGPARIAFSLCEDGLWTLAKVQMGTPLATHLSRYEAAPVKMAEQYLGIRESDQKPHTHMCSVNLGRKGTASTRGTARLETSTTVPSCSCYLLSQALFENDQIFILWCWFW